MTDASADAEFVLHDKASDGLINQTQAFIEADDGLYANDQNGSSSRLSDIVGLNEPNIANVTRSSASGDSFFSVFSRNSNADDLKNTELSETLFEGVQKHLQVLMILMRIITSLKHLTNKPLLLRSSLQHLWI